MAEGEKGKRQWVKDQRRADYAAEFIRKLRIPAESGPPISFCLAPWQEKIVTDLLATVDPKTGERRYNEGFVAVPKKNGKTLLISALVTLFLHSSQSQKEIYSVASTREQAGIIFRDIAHFVRQNQSLSKRLKVIDSRKRIVDYTTGSFFQALSSDAGFSDGIRPSVVIYDELHRAKDRQLFDLLRKSMPTVTNPLFLVITTAGDDKTSVCYEQWDYACKVRDAVIENDRYYPCIFAASSEDDWKSPETWRKANPSLGLFLREEAIAQECQRAIDSPTSLNAFKRYHLNIWTERESAFIELSKWDARTDAIDLNALLKGQVCYCGIDLASARDLSAVVLLFPRPNGDYIVVPRFYMPQDSIRDWEERDKGIPYRAWVEQGHIIATPGNITDYSMIYKDIQSLANQYKICGIAIDRFDASQISTQLSGEGFRVEMFAQSFVNFNKPVRDLERLILDGKIIHGSNPVMRWNISNLVVEMDHNGNVRPSKRKSKQKIDGAVAMMMALAISSQPEKKEEYIGMLSI